MRKSFMTKEYSREFIKGTMNMKEQKSFFTSIMLEIEDIINISDTQLSWTESDNGTQKLKSETITQTYNAITHKFNNHSISLAPNQSDNDVKFYTSWLLNIKIKDILKEYVYSYLKYNRVFEYVNPDYTYNKNMITKLLNYKI